METPYRHGVDIKVPKQHTCGNPHQIYVYFWLMSNWTRWSNVDQFVILPPVRVRSIGTSFYWINFDIATDVRFKKKSETWVA